MATTCGPSYYLSGTFCKHCAKGYVCLAGSTSATPTIAAMGYKCPFGYYCDPNIAIKEIPCPVGTYRNALMG